MGVYDFFIKVGDTLPPVEAVLADALGPVGLTGATVRWHMRLEGTTGALKANAPAVIVSALDGAVRYDWAPADTDTPGVYEAEWEVTFPDSSVITFPNDHHLRVMVRAAVG